MAKKRRGANGGARFSPKRLEQVLLATTFPRLQMSLILALAAIGAFLSSAILVRLHVHSMGARYALAALGGYGSFLLLVRVWIAYQTRNWSFGKTPDVAARRSDASIADVPDLSALGDLGSVAEGGFSGGGGGFGGAGASESFGDALSNDSSSDVLDGISGGDGEGVAIAVAVIAVLGGIVALGFVVYSSPILLAEVLLDFAVVGALYKKNQRHARGHWARGVLRRTYKPMLVLTFFAALFGFAVQTLAPEEHTLGAVLRAHDAARK